jgi:3'(2'), 5'-bisphosphate nucleotidase
MKTIDLSAPELRFAIDVVRQAAILARQIQEETTITPLTKSDSSPVTSADFGVQALVARTLALTFPGEALIAEETSAALRTEGGSAKLAKVMHFVRRLLPDATPEEVCDWIDRGTANPGRRFWTLDPIDGTKGFVRGGQYVVALALIDGGKVQLGILGCPRLGLITDTSGNGEPDSHGCLVAAVRGSGAWHLPLQGPEQPLRLSVSDCGDATCAKVVRSYESEHTDSHLVDELAGFLRLRRQPLLVDSQAKYALLASGKAELFLRPPSPKRPGEGAKIWDHAAGELIVHEAGGRVTDLDGRPLDFSAGRTLSGNRGVVASNGRLHDEALSVLAHLYASRSRRSDECGPPPVGPDGIF